MDPSNLLGPLENEVMDVMWEIDQATVREVVDRLQQRRSIAYTTVMTIMNNLVTKALLKRVAQGKAYRYRVVLSREAFIQRASEEAVSDVLARFGDLAIVRFLEKAAELSPDDLERLRQLAGDNQIVQNQEREDTP